MEIFFYYTSKNSTNTGIFKSEFIKNSFKFLKFVGFINKFKKEVIENLTSIKTLKKMWFTKNLKYLGFFLPDFNEDINTLIKNLY